MQTQTLTYQGRAAPRLWEIDTLRGIAVVLMVFYHFVWDLQYFNLVDVNVYSPGWQTFARGIGSTFIFLLGLSLTLRLARAPRSGSWLAEFGPIARRGAVIFAFGMLITAITYATVGSSFVVFGILHLLGVALILAYPFTRASALVSLLAGLAIIVAGSYLNGIAGQSPWWIWLGIPEQGRGMVDYYPLFPWAGVALLGVAAGKVLYPQGQRRFALPDANDLQPLAALRFLGRHSLIIYLAHQPILFGVLSQVQGLL